jgi:hypothetical protein
VAQPPASRSASIASQIDFAGAALFAFFFSAKGSGLDAALPNLSGRTPVEPELFRVDGGNRCVEHLAVWLNLSPHTGLQSRHGSP